MGTIERTEFSSSDLAPHRQGATKNQHWNWYSLSPMHHAFERLSCSDWSFFFSEMHFAVKAPCSSNPRQLETNKPQHMTYGCNSTPQGLFVSICLAPRTVMPIFCSWEFQHLYSFRMSPSHDISIFYTYLCYNRYVLPPLTHFHLVSKPGLKICGQLSSESWTPIESTKTVITLQHPWQGYTKQAKGPKLPKSDLKKWASRPLLKPWEKVGTSVRLTGYFTLGKVQNMWRRKGNSRRQECSKSRKDCKPCHKDGNTLETDIDTWANKMKLQKVDFKAKRNGVPTNCKNIPSNRSKHI